MKKLITIALIAALSAPILPVNAGQSADVNLTIATWHGGDGEFNDFNPGLIGRLFVTDDRDGAFVYGGFYKNSDVNEASDDWSLVGGGGYEFSNVTSWLDISVSAGFATGYTFPAGDTNQKTLIPMITPTFTILDRVALSLLPVLNNDSSLNVGINAAVRVANF